MLNVLNVEKVWESSQTKSILNENNFLRILILISFLLKFPQIPATYIFYKAAFLGKSYGKQLVRISILISYFWCKKMKKYLKIFVSLRFSWPGFKQRWFDLKRYFINILFSWDILHLASSRVRVTKWRKTKTGQETYNLEFWWLVLERGELSLLPREYLNPTHLSNDVAHWEFTITWVAPHCKEN